MKIFYSRRSWGLGSAIWGILLAAAVYSSWHIYTHRSERDFILNLVIWVPTLILVGSIWFFTSYRFEKDSLTIKIGPILHSRIPYHEIKGIKRSKSIIAAPANSLHRLEVEHGKPGNLTIVSPQREQVFIDLLQEKSPEIKKEI